ncbi:tail fiber assembly protein [Pseudomonas costantinii]
MAPLQDAVDLNIVTSAVKARLTTWKQYRVDVNRVDLTQVGPAGSAIPV